jgi:hypothetical protein
MPVVAVRVGALMFLAGLPGLSRATLNNPATLREILSSIGNDEPTEGSKLGGFANKPG